VGLFLDLWRMAYSVTANICVNLKQETSGGIGGDTP